MCMRECFDFSGVTSSLLPLDLLWDGIVFIGSLWCSTKGNIHELSLSDIQRNWKAI